MNEYKIFTRDLNSIYNHFIFNVFLVIFLILFFSFGMIFNPVYLEMMLSIPFPFLISLSLLLIFLTNMCISAIELKSFLDIKKGSVSNGDF